MTSIASYRCPKCQNQAHTVGEIRTTGGWLSKLFDVQNKRFSTVTCDRCSYTELYAAKQGALGNVFDIFMGG